MKTGTDKNSGKMFVFYSDKINYKAVDGPKGKSYYIEGHMTSGDLDLVNDIVTKSCMDDMTSQFDDRVIKLDYEHEAFRGKSELESQINKTRMPLGKAIDRSRDEKGVKVKWQLNPNWKKFDEKGNLVMSFKDVWNSIENGFLDAFSIAYIPTKTANANREGKDVRLLDKVNLMNVALTGNPINPAATMTAVMAKSLESFQEGDEMQKLNKKGYEKDGNHVHEEGNSMGIHNHGEIEKAINDLWDYYHRMNSRILELESELEKPGEKDPVSSMKSNKTGEKNMADEKKPDEQAKPDQKANDNADKGADKGTEQKGTDDNILMEVKSRMDKLEVDLKAKDDEIKELKGFIEKARIKSKGPEVKSQDSPAPEQKSVGTLDFI